MTVEESSANVQRLKLKRSEPISSKTSILILNCDLDQIALFTLSDLNGKSLQIICSRNGDIHSNINTFIDTEDSHLGLNYNETILQLKNEDYQFQVSCRDFCHKGESNIFRNGSQINQESYFANTSLFTFPNFHIYITNSPDSFLLSMPYLYMDLKDMLLLGENVAFLQPILSAGVISYFNRCVREEKKFRWEISNLTEKDLKTSKLYVNKILSILHYHSKKFKIYLF